MVRKQNHDGNAESRKLYRAFRNCAIVAIAPLVVAMVAMVAQGDSHGESLPSGASSVAPPEAATIDLQERYRQSLDDPVERLLYALSSGDFDNLEQVATGRLLEEWPEKNRWLHGVDLNTVRLERRGNRWLIVRATSSARWPHRFSTEVRIRFVHEEDGWRVENAAPTPGAADSFTGRKP